MALRVKNEYWRSMGTSLVGSISVAYRDLVTAFGEPAESDGHKVSGEWTLVDEEDRIFTIYDWKKTSLYDPDAPSVEEFRSDPNPQIFNIGGVPGMGSVESFKNKVMHEIWEKNIFKDKGGCETCGKSTDGNGCIHDERHLSLKREDNSNDSDEPIVGSSKKHESFLVAYTDVNSYGKKDSKDYVYKKYTFKK